MSKVIFDYLETVRPFEPEFRKFNHPIFLTGLMRSGTSLLLNILTEHPQLLKAGVELNRIWTLYGGASCADHCDHLTRKDVKPEFVVNMTSYFKDCVTQERKIRYAWKRLLFSLKNGSGGVNKNWGNLYLVNKSPHLSNKILYLTGMFPEAKIVHIIRSIESHSYSMKLHFDKGVKNSGIYNFLPEDENSCWTRMSEEELKPYPENRKYPSNFALIPEAWINLNYHAIKELQNLNENQYRIYSYEELIQFPEKVIPEIFSFLNLKNDYSKIVNKIANKKRKSFNAHTEDPLNSWKTKLSVEQKEQIEKTVSKLSEKYQFIQETIKQESSLKHS